MQLGRGVGQFVPLARYEGAAPLSLGWPASTQGAGPMPTTVFFASNRILHGDPALVTSYGPQIQPPSVSTGIVYGTAFVDGIDVQANEQGSITSIQDTNRGSFSVSVTGDLSDGGRNLLVFLHGFDNDFEDGITRAAFNREFL